MRLLLDTQVFLWFDSGNPRLDPVRRTVIVDPTNEIYLSVASIWECAVKHRLGRLMLPGSPEIHLVAVREQAGIEALVIDDGSVFEVAKLPLIHRDPFDRIIVAQAIQHGLTLVTEDSILKSYPVACL